MLNRKFDSAARELFLHFPQEEEESKRGRAGAVRPTPLVVQLAPLHLTPRQSRSEHLPLEPHVPISDWHHPRPYTSQITLSPVPAGELAGKAQLFFQRQLDQQRTSSANTPRQREMDKRFTLLSAQSTCSLKSLEEFRQLQRTLRSSGATAHQPVWCVLPAPGSPLMQQQNVGGYCGNVVWTELTNELVGVADAVGVCCADVGLIQFGQVRWIKFPCLHRTCDLDFDSAQDRHVHELHYCPLSLGMNRRTNPPPLLPPKPVEYSLHSFDAIGLDVRDWSSNNGGTMRRILVRPHAGSLLRVSSMRFSWENTGMTGIRALTWTLPETMVKKDEDEEEKVASFRPMFLQPAPPQQVGGTVQTYWGLTIPPGALGSSGGGESLPPRRHLILHRAACGTPVEFANEIGPQLNLLRFDDVTLFGGGSGCGVEYRSNLAANYFTSTHAAEWMFAKSGGDDDAEVSTGRSVAQACMVSVSCALDHALRESREAAWEDHLRQERERFTPVPCATGSDTAKHGEGKPAQPLTAFLRNMVQSCVDCAVHACKHPSSSTTAAPTAPAALEEFVIVLGGGEDTGDDDDDDATIDCLEKYLRGSGTSAVCKILVLDASPSAAKQLLNAVACSAALNRSGWFNQEQGEDDNLVYALSAQGDNDNKLQLFARVKLALEWMEVATAASTKIWVTPDSAPMGDGFVVAADLPPARSLTLAATTTSTTRVVLYVTQFETPPPLWIWGLNEDVGGYIPVVAQRLDVGCCLEAVQELCFSARVAASRGMPVKQFMRMARVLVNQPLLPSGKSHTPPSTITEGLLGLMRRRKRLAALQTYVRETLNQVDSTALAFKSNAQTATAASAAAEWISKPLSFKFGAKMLKRVAAAATLGDDDDDDDEDKMLLQAKLECGLPGNSPHNSMVELLYTVPVDCDAIRIKVVRTDVAAIDPFLVRVLVVSSDIVQQPDSTQEQQHAGTAGIMREIDLGVVRKDGAGWGMRVPDALLLEPSRAMRNQVLFKAFNACMLTRNPTLQLPDQYLALVMVSFVRSCEQLMKWRDVVSSATTTSRLPDYTLDNVLPFIRSTRRIFSVLQSFSARDQLSPRMRQVVRGWAIAGDDDAVIEFARWIGPRMDTGEGVASVAEMVCAACLFPEHGTPGKRMAMLAEAVARQARIVVRKRRAVARRVLRGAFGYEEEDDGSTIKKIDVQRGFDFTTRFFAQPCQTNCSAWAVVSTLQLGALFHAGRETDEAIFHRLSATPQISMAQFLADNAPPQALAKPRLFQIALFAQAFAWITREERAQHAAEYMALLMPQQREQDELAPRLQCMANAERESMRMDRVLAQKQLMRQGKLASTRELRREIALAEQRHFMAAHQHAPRVFLQHEVARLNLQRPANDQLELDQSSGLLLHHCCFEQCALFLCNLATDKDRVNGARTGLFKHLSRSQRPDPEYYVKELHLRSKAWIVYPNLSSVRCTRQAYLAELRAFLTQPPPPTRTTRRRHPPAKLSSKRVEELMQVGEQIYDRWRQALE